MPRKPNPELQEKLAAVKRDQILDAARAVFAEKDFHRATIKDVAARAGVADGTVYNYFENKNALILGLMQRFTGNLSAEPRRTPAQPLSLESTIRGLTGERFALLSAESLELLRAVLPEVLTNPGLRDLFRAGLIQQSDGEANDLIGALSALSGLDEERVRLNLHLEAALFMGLVVLRLIGDDLLERRWSELPETISALMLEAFRQGQPS